ncbi:hypothetical protein [Chelatococcus asaccharovorans]|uniref:hypothetical protein n=1 Tax=Chelatococcus asaccharovorans TaxID=28210 RepID=UPI002B26CFED|nr:hypothetical protein [Chelatococcus asaccharovorans]
MGILNMMIPAASAQLGTRQESGNEATAHQKQIWALRFFLDRERRIRDRALSTLR